MDLSQLVPVADVAGSQKRLGQGIAKLSTLEGSQGVGRVRALADLRDFIREWQLDTDRRIAGLHRLLSEDVGAIIEAARTEKVSNRRKGAALVQRRISDAKVGRAIVELSLRLLEDRKGTRRWLRDAGIELAAARELTLAKEIDKLSGPLRGALERLLETMDDTLDVAVVLAARIDPTNDGPSVSLDALA